MERFSWLLVTTIKIGFTSFYKLDTHPFKNKKDPVKMQCSTIVLT